MGTFIERIFFPFLFLAHTSSAKNVLDLTTHPWTLHNDALNISVPARLPSQAHLDLFAAGVIGDPYHDLNDFNLRWVALNNWTYSSGPIEGISTTSSNSSKSDGNSSISDKDTWLLFDGLDTFASIELCGRHVASTNNQFRQWWFDVSDIIVDGACDGGAAVLSMNFGSAPTIANQMAGEPGAETWPYGVQQVFEFPNRWFIRKEQSDFGWDWGPAMAPAGPWQPAYVVQLGPNEIHVRNSDVDIYREGQLNLIPPDQSKNWVVNASLDYIGTLPEGATMSYILKDSDSNTTVSQGQLSKINCTNGAITGSTTIPSEAVELWWPAGLGPQKLYHLTVNVQSTSDNKNSTLATVTKRTGFRTIVLNEFPISQSQLDQGIAPGNNWHFEVNGHEFYAKGSNFIPPDAFWPRVTAEKMSRLLDSVVDGNQNMLRVWASGAYSPDFLYDLADERGILLWSEFEFGDALYPVDKDFLENVREEAEYNVRRVNHHPSLALWAGGNELENLELKIVEQVDPEGLERFRGEYETLFLETLGPAVFENSRSISYTPSSTSNGWQELDFSKPVPIVERYDNLTEGSVYGETDFYNYNVSVLYNSSAYPIGRFSNEFGFHSMPSIYSWRQQVSEEYLSFNSSVVMLRDHHPPPGGLNTSNYANASIGQAQMTEGVEMWYPVPDKTDPVANFSAWCHATQIFQADLYVNQIRFYRRGSGLPNRQLGSLYWQLEDIWVAPTWSSIEYDGRWKVLHYAAKHAFEPVIIAPYSNTSTGDISVWVTSDLWESISGSATFEWYDWSGNSLGANITATAANFTVGAINSTQVLLATEKDLLAALPDPRNAVLKMTAEASGSLPNTHNDTRTFRHEAWLWASTLNTAALVDPGLELEYSNSTGNFTVRATKGVAAWVWLEHGAGVLGNFGENAFWLGRGEEKEVGFKVKSDSTGGKWVGDVSVQSLWNMTLKE